jgi:hypothetical protein
MWELLAKKIKAQLGINITAADIATLQAREIGLAGEMGISPEEAHMWTTWWHLREGSMNLVDHASRIKKQFYALHEGVLAVPQEASGAEIFLATQKGQIEDLQVGLTAGGGAGIIRGLAGMNLLRELIQRLGAGRGAAAFEVVKRTLGPTGQMAVVQYNRLPVRLRDQLAQAGVTAALLAGFTWGDEDDDDEFQVDADIEELIAEMMEGGNGAGMLPAIPNMMLGGGIVKAWSAGNFKNGSPITFYRTADGLVWVQRENGTWKSFRYKKGVMIYSDGATTLRSFLRADRALDHQAKQLRRALDRRAPRRQPRALKAPTIIETGPGSVHVR